ncbi:MAG: hypothetical protein E6I52_06140 [Chloroflexi bacterium]|nr:MAG: hypothetical protein E6I52_06140 [Chloroflexota bacterium]
MPRLITPRNCAAHPIVGYTIANDVSSRSIDGDDPLYLPQAKLYAGSCALGPDIVPAWQMSDHMPWAFGCASCVRAPCTGRAGPTCGNLLADTKTW